jgi:hypothetical protein
MHVAAPVTKGSKKIKREQQRQPSHAGRGSLNTT